MKRSPQQTVLSPKAWRPRWEPLESRLALSNSGVTSGDPDFGDWPPTDPFGDFGPMPSSDGINVVATSPGFGSTLTESPAALVVTVDRPLDPDSLFLTDFQLIRIEDGVNLLDGDTAVFPELDGTGTEVSLSLAGIALSPGQYRVVLSGLAFWTGLDGSMLTDLGTDQTLSEFQVEQSGLGLSGSIDLGRVGSTPLSVPDFLGNPNDVRLYRFDLPEGNYWRLGIEVTAQRDGSPLNSLMTLFDAQGNPLAVADVGRPDAPRDPFLFLGLAPGTYYVGVSGTGNAPGQSGGYDPVTGLEGTGGLSGNQGAFTLHLVADANDLPPSLIGFRLDDLAPSDPTPTGFTMQFSSLLRTGETSGGTAASFADSVEVIDQNGQLWSVLPIGYDELNAQISFLFQSRLPVGQYQIRLKTPTSLTDLAGLAPVSPGLPQGVLATFAVQPLVVGLPATVLGALQPEDALAGVSRAVSLEPYDSITYHFVQLLDGYTSLDILPASSPISVFWTNLDTGEQFEFDPSDRSFHQLPAGEYLLEFETTLTGSAFSFTLKSKGLNHEELLGNGLGQGPALNLRLIHPSNGLSSPDNVPPGSTGGTGPGPGIISGPFLPTTPGTPSTNGPGTGQGQSGSVNVSVGFLSDLVGDLVGRPSLDSTQVGTVGGPTGQGVATLAANGVPVGVGQSVPSPSAVFSDFFRSNGEVPVKPDDHEPETPVPIDGGMAATVAPERATVAEVLAEANPGLVGRLLASLDALFNAASPGDLAPGTMTEEIIQLAGLEPSGSPVTGSEGQKADEEKTEVAGFGSPLDAGVLALLVIQTRRLVRRWRKKPGLSNRGGSSRMVPHGPHRPI